MFKNFTIGKKIHFPIIFMMVLGLAIITINATNTFNKITTNSYLEYSKIMKIFLNKLLDEKKQVSLTNAINLSLNQQIINSLKNNDRKAELLLLKNIAKNYKKYSKYKDIKLHIHTKDTKSFIRHWNKDKFGDDLSGFRKSLVFMKDHQKPFITVENGRAGMLIRGVSPIFDNENYIGSIEFIQGFNSIAQRIKNSRGYDTLFLSCRDTENIDMFNKNIQKVSGLYLANTDFINKDLVKTLSDFEPKYFEKNKYLVKDGFFITSFPIKDIFDKKVGCVIIATEISKVSQFIREAKESMVNQLWLIIVIDILLLLGLMYILHIWIKTPIDHLIESIKKIDNNLNKSNLKELYIEHKIGIETKDEIGNISNSVNKLLKTTSKLFTDFQESEKHSQEYIKAVDAGSIVSKSDLKGTITYVNDELCKRTGYTKEELIGKPHNIFRHPNTPKKAFKVLWERIQKGEIYNGLFKNKKKDGSSFYAKITIVPIKDQNENIVEYIALRDDVTELVNSKKVLKKQFLTDPLTSFGNRFKMVEDIEKKKSFNLLILDIHLFKELNDFYGYKIGDMIIKNLGDRLFKHFNSNHAEVYHLHGDEFAVLYEKKYINNKEFYILVNSFIDQNKQSIIIEENQISIRLTCGISYNQNNLITEADIAHKKAKKTNNDILEYSETFNSEEEYKNNLEWTNEIKNAIEENRIITYFQPIINTKTHKIEKYETLMRLVKKDGEVVSPFFFLDIAKKTRYYRSLTKIVVTQAFKKFSGTVYEFSINLSAEDIMVYDISSWLFELADEYRVNNQVVIEIVESEGIESFDMVDTFIQKAKDRGMKIAIDDFGTGYSNFEYLIKLNTDFLKIDGSLIKEIDKDEKLYSIVETIVDFAKKNNIKTIGEFVSTKKIYEKIQELDIDYGQGFELGKPNKDIHL